MRRIRRSGRGRLGGDVRVADEPSADLTRRRFFTTAGAVAAAGVAGAVVGAAPAGASSGANLIIGNTGNNADADPTSLQSTAATHVLLGQNNGNGGGLIGRVTAVASAGQVGVLGDATTGGTADQVGVKGQALGSNGFGVLGSNTGGGTGVFGTASGGGGAGVSGISSGTGPGVFASGPTGLTASGATTGVAGTSPTLAVSGSASGGGVGVFGSAASGVGLKGSSGTGAPLLLVPSGLAGAPATGVHARGELFVDNAGNLFLCTAAGTPGTWTKLNAQSAVGGLTTLASPSRVFDSRTGQANQAPNVQGALSFTVAPPSAASRDVSCQKDAVSGATVVPSTATALLLNLTATGTAGGGALSVYAHGSPQPATSSINWSSGGLTIANAVTSKCDASQHIDVAIVAGTGASTNFIVDVVGFYT